MKTKVNKVWMERASGYGSYYIFFDTSDGLLKIHTNDSLLWDRFDGSQKQIKQLVKHYRHELAMFAIERRMLDV